MRHHIGPDGVACGADRAHAADPSMELTTAWGAVDCPECAAVAPPVATAPERRLPAPPRPPLLPWSARHGFA